MQIPYYSNVQMHFREQNKWKGKSYTDNVRNYKNISIKTLIKSQ